MSTYHKISLAQVDIDAFADYVVAKKKLVYREGDETTADNKAQDVEQVYGIDANYIATVPDSRHRDTVLNALQLNGRPASDYMTQTEGGSLKTKYLRTQKQYGDEIQNLTDELYTLRQELAKGGFIEDRGEYGGYVDTFRKSAPKHLHELLATAQPGEENNEIIIEDLDAYNALDVYDYIVLQNRTFEKFTVRQIAEKDDETHTLILSDSIDDDIRNAENDIEIYLSHGINDEGMFKFAKEAELAMGDENHTGLSDDTFRKMLNIQTSNTGFAYSFRIPEEKQGFVTSFEICAKAYGTPGSMICYLIDARDLDNFHSPAQAKADYETAKATHSEDFHFFAASKPLTLSSAYGRRYIKFDFLQEDDTYPLMTQDEDGTVRYIAVIECLDCDNDNYYAVQFLQHRNSEGQLGDLELNNITYEYIRRPDGSSRKALETNDTINATDMYYHIVTRSIVEHEVDPEREGLYTFHVHTKDVAHKARVMLRVRKEGAYAANTESDVQRLYNQEQILLTNTDEENGISAIADLQLNATIYQPLELRTNSGNISEPNPVILGNNISKLMGQNDTSITVTDPVLLKNGDAVYRCGYIVSLKARYYTGHEAVEPAYKHFVLPLTEVFKDFRPLDKTASARLIFETNLYKLETDGTDYNDFIVQIYWSNPNMATRYKNTKKAQMGAIKDIAVSFNQGY